MLSILVILALKTRRLKEYKKHKKIHLTKKSLLTLPAAVYQDLQALEREVNLDTDEFPDQTIPNADAPLDYIAPLNNPVENEEVELEIQLPDQGQKDDNEKVEDKEADNQDNQGSDQENQ